MSILAGGDPMSNGNPEIAVIRAVAFGGGTALYLRELRIRSCLSTFTAGN